MWCTGRRDFTSIASVTVISCFKLNIFTDDLFPNKSEHICRCNTEWKCASMFYSETFSSVFQLIFYLLCPFSDYSYRKKQNQEKLFDFQFISVNFLTKLNKILWLFSCFSLLVCESTTTDKAACSRCLTVDYFIFFTSIVVLGWRIYKRGFVSPRWLNLKYAKVNMMNWFNKYIKWKLIFVRVVKWTFACCRSSFM